MIDDGTVALRLVVAAGLGGLIGLERELKDQPAGLRTHLLVALGACLFTLVSAYGFDGERAGTDVTRIASQVVVGIGFLGGGTILRHSGTVRGLTTAASLWVTAAVGLAIGAGFVVGALVAGGIAFVALLGLKPFEKRLFGRQATPPPD